MVRAPPLSAGRKVMSGLRRRDPMALRSCGRKLGLTDLDRLAAINASKCAIADLVNLSMH